LNRSLLYNNQGRGGTIVYKDDKSSISFDFEYGGGDCIAIIFIPSEKYWEAQTGRSIAERKDILEFVAIQSAKDQTFNGTYKILDSFIELYKC
jgi:hypothetical protein